MGPYLSCRLPQYVTEKKYVFSGLALNSVIQGSYSGDGTMWDLVYLFGVLCRFQHCTGHITMGSWKGRGNQYIQFVRVLYCKTADQRQATTSFPT